MHPFAEYVKILGRGKNGSRSLSFAEAKASMAMILNDETEELQLGAFLMLLRVKEESPEEMAGFVAACREAINTPKIQVDIDWSSYAGKRRHLPWFILSALAMAQSGIRIFIHGATGHTPDRVYTEHVFEQLILPLLQFQKKQFDHYRLMEKHLMN